MPMLCGVTSVTAMGRICSQDMARCQRNADGKRWHLEQLRIAAPCAEGHSLQGQVARRLAATSQAGERPSRGSSVFAVLTPPCSMLPGVSRAASIAAPCMTASSESTAVSGGKSK